MNWKIGQKVVCVARGGWLDIDNGAAPVGPAPLSNEIYTYDGIDPTSTEHIYLKEFTWIDRGERCSWERNCFRPIVDIGDEVEEYIKSKITEPEYA